jgi:hypothetical protein
MFVIPLIIFLAAVAADVAVVAGNHQTVTLTLFDWHWSVQGWALAAVGAGLLAVALLALKALAVSGRRSRRNRAERKALLAENRRLARAAVRETAPTGGYVPSATPAYPVVTQTQPTLTD